jgi:hypothetical protein
LFSKIYVTVGGMKWTGELTKTKLSKIEILKPTLVRARLSVLPSIKLKVINLFIGKWIVYLTYFSTAFRTFFRAFLLLIYFQVMVFKE